MRKLIASFLILSMLLSCNNSDDEPKPSVSVNDFVWKAMNLWYYWQKNVPNLADDRFTNDTEYTNFLSSHSTPNLFNNLLYATSDRFSWIVENYEVLDNSFAGIQLSYGMEYGLIYLNSSSNQVIGYVQYVVPNSPADLAGIKRGYIFDKINGTTITDSNYSNLLSLNSATFNFVKLVNNQLVDLNLKISMQKTQVNENPVYLSEVLHVNGQKIGYLVYNSFRANYNDELNQAIMQLKQGGITDLIIDLRYNGGGSVQTSAYLGSMVTGQFVGQAFTNLTFNEKASSNNTSYNFENVAKKYNDNLEVVGEFPIENLNLNRLFVITSSATASASEMLIYCLKSYIPVKTVGMKTYGKNVGSITLYDSPSTYYTSKTNVNTQHKWAMQPIVFEYRNAQNYSAPTPEIYPDAEINELSFISNLKPLGSLEEPLLARTILEITGSDPIQPFQPTSQEAKKIFKTSTQIKPFGTELYLDPGFDLKP